MNRNIITTEDVQRSPFEAESQSPPTVDDFFGRLLKYTPLEMIGAYVAVDGLLRSGLHGRALQAALSLLLVAGAVAVWLFGHRVLGVMRPLQLHISVLAFIVWVLATGGVFATLSWWRPWEGTVGIVVFAVVVRIANVRPLPATTEAMSQV